VKANPSLDCILIRAALEEEPLETVNSTEAGFSSAGAAHKEQRNGRQKTRTAQKATKGRDIAS
jgi:hypothetical protein